MLALGCFTESSRSDYTKLGKKVEDIDNMLMEIEIQLTSNPEMQVVHTEFSSNVETISKFKKDVARFLFTTDKLDKDLADLLVLVFVQQLKLFQDEAFLEYILRASCTCLIASVLHRYEANLMWLAS